MRFCYSGLQSEGPPRHEHISDTKRGVASAMKPPRATNSQKNRKHTKHPNICCYFVCLRYQLVLVATS